MHLISKDLGFDYKGTGECVVSKYTKIASIFIDSGDKNKKNLMAEN